MSKLSQSSVPPAISSLDWGFLRRTAISTVVTGLLIGLMTAVNYSMEWAARYTFFALWSVGFFSLSALIFKFLVFSPSRGIGLILIQAKVIALALVWIVFYKFPIQGDAVRAQELAVVCGILTPFAVLMLRIAGRVVDLRPKRLSLGPDIPPPPAADPHPTEKLKPLS